MGIILLKISGVVARCLWGQFRMVTASQDLDLELSPIPFLSMGLLVEIYIV